MRFEILVFPGFDELDALAPYEVLANAASAGADFSTRLVSLHGPEEITASHGTAVRSQGRIGPESPADVLIVPGGGWAARSPQGARAEAARGDIPRLLADLHGGGGVTIASVCTGAMLLAAAGLLKDRPAVTHHSAYDDLVAAGATLVRARVVDAGEIVTSGGVTSGLDLALHLTERFAGAALAVEVERRMEYERRGTVWRARNLQ